MFPDKRPFQVHNTAYKAGQQDGSLGKGACPQAWWPAFNFQTHMVHGGQTAPASCPLTSTLYYGMHQYVH